jgi:peptidoglycan/LPS O-acetylase OafA/YrhL
MQLLGDAVYLMDKAYHPDRLSGHLPSLDGWRAIAILFVLAEHGAQSVQQFTQVGGSWAVAGPFKGIGQLGVQLFFGLSGFLITSKLIEEISRNGVVSLQQFYLRRTFRIIPAAATFLIMVYALTALNQISVHPYRMLAAMLFFANYVILPIDWYVGHFWSLAVEEHYYLIWPVIFIVARKPSTLVKLLIFSAIAIAIWRAVDYKFVLTGASPAIFWGRSDIQADTIAYGSLAAILIAVFGKAESARLIDKTWIFILACIFICASRLTQVDWKVWMLLLTARNIAIAAIVSISVLGGLRGGYTVL